MHFSPSPDPHSPLLTPDIPAHLDDIDSKLDALRDLILASHLQLEKAKDATKETGANVARIHLKLDQVIKQAIKVATKIHACSDSLCAVITNQFTNLKDAITNTLAYFLSKFIPPDDADPLNPDVQILCSFKTMIFCFILEHKLTLSALTLLIVAPFYMYVCYLCFVLSSFLIDVKGEEYLERNL